MDDYCPCCVDEQEYARLVEPKLEDVGHEAIDHYLFNAICTWGDINGFKRFLPRIYEALAFERHECFWSVGMWLPITKLAYGNWQEWPRYERRSIERYLVALWSHVLDGGPSHPDGGLADDADDVIEGLATIYCDIQPFLDVWTAKVHKSLGAAERLAQFLRFNSGFFRKHESLGIEDWTAGAEAQVREWLRDPLLIGALATWLEECEDEAVCRSLLEAMELLELYQENQ